MSTISCTEFQRLLGDAVELNGDVTAVPLSEHAAACPECREQWHHHCLLEQAITDWRAQMPATDLVEAIVARYAFDRPVPAKHTDDVVMPSRGNDDSPRRHAWVSVVVAAAAILVTSWTLFHSSLATRESQLASSSPPKNSSTPIVVADNNDDELETLVEHAGSAYRNLASQAAEAMVEASRAVAPTRLAMLQTDETENEEPKSSGWGNDLKPIGREFGKALDFLFDTVPTENQSI